MSQESIYRVDSGYVDIHGNDIKVLVCDKTGEILVPVSGVRNMGFQVIKRSQYNRLHIDADQFNREFDLFMLQSAQSYMLENRIAFKENEIIESINKCKQMLIGGAPSSPATFAKNHVIGHSPDNNITITTNLRQPVLNLHNQNERRSNFGYQKNSPTSSVKSFEIKKDYKPNFNQNRERDNDRFNTPFDSTSSKNTYELRKPKSLIHPNQTSPSSHNGYQRRENENGELQEIPRLQSVEFSLPEHTVVVSHVESSGNWLWVQDIDNADTLLNIDAKVKEEVNENKKSGRFYNLEKIYLAQDDGLWFRCKVIKFKPLKVFFVDYGNTAEVNEVKDASEELAKIPCQAIKVRIDKEAQLPDVSDTITIKIKKRIDYAYLVEIKTDDSDSSTKAPKHAPVLTIPTFFIKPQPICQLEDGQKVMIVAEIDAKLALRTRECYDTLKLVEREIEDLTPQPVNKVEKGQLVLCNKNKLQRGVVTQVEGNSIEVELLDYYEKIQVDISKINHITESLSQQHVTYLVSPRLSGFNEESAAIVKQLIDCRAKTTVVLNGGEFDLKLPDEDLLSNKLKRPDKSRFMLKQMKMFKPELGLGDYMLNFVRASDEIYISAEEAVANFLDSIVKATSDFDNDDPYDPVVGEVCFGLFQDTWSRCVILRKSGANYEVQYIDFGNVESVRSEQLRKLSDDVKDVPVLGIRCRIDGLPVSILKEKEGDSFEINIKRYSDDLYDIEIPSLKI